MRKLLRGVSRWLAPHLPFAPLRRLSGEPLLLPFYHLVVDGPVPLHVRALYPVRHVTQFQADLQFLLRHYEPVGLAEVRAHLTEGRPWRRPVMHLTFDDGLRECADVVAPVLRELGVPATFFLNPDFLDNRALMFRYQASLVAEVDTKKRYQPLRVPYAERARLTEWARELGIDFDEYLRTHRPYLSSAQVRGLLGQGFTIGAHSLDHPLYAELPLAEQVRQTVESVRAVRQQFGLTGPMAFAFPFTDDGVSQQFFADVRRLEPGLLTFGGAGVKRDVVTGHLQRFPMETTTVAAGSALTAEYFYHLLKRPLGRNVVRRAPRTDA